MLTTDAVHDIFKEVGFKTWEDTSHAVLVEGLITNFGFHPERLAMAKPSIDALLKDLPDKFMEGWSFLNACRTRSGVLWGQHRTMELLFCLGIGVGSAEWLGKNVMASMPGGVPYVQIFPATSAIGPCGPDGQDQGSPFDERSVA